MHTASKHGSHGHPTKHRLWHPFSDLRLTSESVLEIVEGDGVRVRDSEGRWYLDATAGLWYANVGHGREEIVEAICSQARTLAAYSTFGDFSNPPAAALACRVAELAPLEDPRVFFTSGGSDSVESAVKIVRRHWDLRGEPARTHIVSRQSSYHGMHGFGTALAGIAANSAGYGNGTVEGFERFDHEDPDDLETVIDRIGATRVAAVFAEPVIGAGGVIPPPADYFERVREICDRHDVLLVADEVISGFGRLGAWFGSDRYHIQPDVILVAKGITSGYQPLGAVIASRRVWEPFADPEHPALLRHGYTYSGHATACAAALANLEIIEREKLVHRVGALEPVLESALVSAVGQPGITASRSAGLIGALQLDPANLDLAPRAAKAARQHGVLTRAIVGNALQISPPFTIEPSEIADIVTALVAATADALAQD